MAAVAAAAAAVAVAKNGAVSVFCADRFTYLLFCVIMHYYL